MSIGWSNAEYEVVLSPLVFPFRSTLYLIELRTVQHVCLWRTWRSYSAFYQLRGHVRSLANTLCDSCQRLCATPEWKDQFPRRHVFRSKTCRVLDQRKNALHGFLYRIVSTASACRSSLCLLRRVLSEFLLLRLVHPRQNDLTWSVLYPGTSRRPLSHRSSRVKQGEQTLPTRRLQPIQEESDKNCS